MALRLCRMSPSSFLYIRQYPNPQPENHLTSTTRRRFLAESGHSETWAKTLASQSTRRLSSTAAACTNRTCTLPIDTTPRQSSTSVLTTQDSSSSSPTLPHTLLLPSRYHAHLPSASLRRGRSGPSSRVRSSTRRARRTLRGRFTSG